MCPKPLAVVIPAPSLIPSSARLLTLCFTCLLPGSQFSEGGRCDLGSGRLHQPRAPGRFPQVISVPWYFLQEKTCQQHRQGAETRLGGAWRTFLPGANPKGRPASPEMQPEIPVLPPSVLLAGKRDSGNSGTVGRSPGESHPTWEWARPAQHFYFQSTACLSVLGGHCPGCYSFRHVPGTLWPC